MNKKELFQKLIIARNLINECLISFESINSKNVADINNKIIEENLPENNVLNINFELHSRAFFKKYAKNLSGPKNFTLVVAYLLKGKLGADVSMEEIKNCWNKNFHFLGGKKLTYGTYGTRAKEGGWIDSKKQGIYELTSNWQEIIN